MSEIRVIGLDPSLRNTGLALARIDINTLAVSVDEIRLYDTEKQSGKQVRVNSDDLRRAHEIVAGIHDSVAGYGATFAISEIPSGSQSARSNLGFGICIGALASLQLAKVPLIQVQPTETKLASIGTKTASKNEIIAWAYAKYPNLAWIKSGSSKRVGKLTDKNEHLADAIAVIHAGVRTTEFSQAAALMAGMLRAA